MARAGRPPADISRFNTQVFEALCAVWATEQDCMAEFQLSERALLRAIRTHYGATFGKRCNFDSVAQHFRRKGTLSIRRFYLSQALGRDAQGNAKHPGMLRHAIDRFGEMAPGRTFDAAHTKPSPVTDPGAAAELAAQQQMHGATAAPDLTTPAGLEAERARRLAELLTNVLKGSAPARE